MTPKSLLIDSLVLATVLLGASSIVSATSPSPSNSDSNTSATFDCLGHFIFRTYDGSCNHLGHRKNDGRGSIMSLSEGELETDETGQALFTNTYIRGIEGAEFSTTFHPIVEVDNPGEIATSRIIDRGENANPRNISNVLSNNQLLSVPSGDPRFPQKLVSITPDSKNEQSISMLEVIFGQFINHDQELNLEVRTVTNPEGDEERVKNESVRIFIPDNDPYRADPVLTEGNTWPYQILNPSQGEEINGQFEVFNGTNSWLDLSTIYGKSEEEAERLRTGVKLATSHYEVLHPTVATEFSQPCFVEVPTAPGAPPVQIDLSPFACTPRAPISLTELAPSKTLTGLATDVAITNFDSLCNPLKGSASPGPDFLAGMPCQSVLDPGTSPDDFLLTSGDLRVNENIGLGLMHTLWIREHNRIVEEVYQGKESELTFQLARRLNTALYQKVVFEEYLPAVLGETLNAEIIGDYTGYRPWVKPETSLLFATAAFRYGHSAIADFPALRGDGSVIPTVDIELANPLDPFSPLTENIFTFGFGAGPQTLPVRLVLGGGEAGVIRGMIGTYGAKIDTQFNEAFRSIINGNLTGLLLDIPALDIMRGRLNGVPNYHTLRKLYFGLEGDDLYQNPNCEATESSLSPDPLACFELMTGNLELAEKLQSLYGKLNNIDGFIGLLAEDNNTLPNSELGLTVATILALEYKRKRDSDRFYFERLLLGPKERAYLENRTMLDVVADNTQAGGRVEINEAFPFGPRTATFVQQQAPGTMEGKACLKAIEQNSFKVVDFESVCGNY